MSGIRKYLLLYAIALCQTALYLPAQAQTNYYNADQQPAASGSAAAENENAPPSHTVVVTSIQKCYAQLGHAEALDIERNFVKPYEECQRRLVIKLKKQQQLKVAHDKDTGTSKDTNNLKDGDTSKDTDAPKDAKDSNDTPEAAPAVNGGFYRVQKNPVPPPANKPATKKPDPAAGSKAPATPDAQ